MRLAGTGTAQVWQSADMWRKLLPPVCGGSDLPYSLPYSYRLCDPADQKLYGKSPLFGQYFVLENPGTISVGDPVYLLGE